MHARVEAGLDLLAPDLSAARLRAVLGRMAGFWAGGESVLDEWADAEPRTATDLRWPRRRRAAAFRHDLLQLGAEPSEVARLPQAPAVFGPRVRPAHAQVLGWLYVTEGSTLGGAVITRRLHTPLRSFTPYAEGPGPMWQDYQRALGDWVGDREARSDEVAAAALTTFEALERWLAPVLRREAVPA